MGGAGRTALLLLLGSVIALTAEAVRPHHNSTAAWTAEERDEEGYRYGGKFVPNWASQPPKGKFLQFPYATCPSPYDTFSFVTKIRVCRDTDGFITGIRYFSEHPTRHHDPTTVCDAVGREGASDCETLKLYTEDWKWRRYRTVTNVRTAKVRDGRDRWRVVYLAFSYSDGSAVEFGTYPNQNGAKVEQWYMKPEPGKICGLNGFYSVAAVCDQKSGYLQWVKPCGKCIPKPHNYKCDVDYCTRKIKHKYKGGYKGDFVEDDLYKDVYDLDGHMQNQTDSYTQQQQQTQYNQQYGADEGLYGARQAQGGYESGQYEQVDDGSVSYSDATEPQQPEFVERPVKQPLMQQQQKPLGRHEQRAKQHLDRKAEREEAKQEKQQKQAIEKQAAQQTQEHKLGFKWPFPVPKLG